METLVSYPATISEIDIIIGTLFASIIAAPIIIYYHFEDTFIGGPSKIYGIFQAAAIHTTCSMIVQGIGEQWKREDKPNYKKLETSRPYSDALKEVLTEQHKLDKNTCNISLTNIKIEENKQGQKNKATTREWQKEVNSLKEELSEYEGCPIHLEAIYNYVNFAKEQASLDAQANRSEEEIQTLRKLFPQLILESTHTRAKITIYEERKRELEEKKQEIMKKDEGTLAIAEKNVTNAELHYNVVRDDRNEKWKKIYEKKLELEVVKATISYASQKEFPASEKSISQVSTEKLRKELASLWELFNAVNLRLYKLNSKVLNTNNHKETLKKTIQDLEHRIQSVDKSLQDYKEIEKTANQTSHERQDRSLKERQTTLDAEIQKIQDQLATIDDINDTKLTIEKLNAAVSKGKADLGSTAPDESGYWGFVSTEGVEKLKKKKTTDEEACAKAKTHLDQCDTICFSITQEKERREKEKRNINDAIARLTSELSEITSSIKEINEPPKNVETTEELVRQGFGSSSDNPVKSASTQLLKSIQGKESSNKKEKKEKEEKEKKKESTTENNDLLDAISEELNIRERRIQQLQQRHDKCASDISSYKQSLFQIDSSKGKKCPKAIELIKLFENKEMINSMDIKYFDEALKLADIERESAKKEYNDKQGVSKKTNKKLEKAETLVTEIDQNKQRIEFTNKKLKDDKSSYQALSRDLLIKLIEKNALTIQLNSIGESKDTSSLHSSNASLLEKAELEQQKRQKEITLAALDSSSSDKKTHPPKPLFATDRSTLSYPAQKTIIQSSENITHLEHEKSRLSEELIKLEKDIIDSEASEKALEFENMRIAGEKKTAQSNITDLKKEQSRLTKSLEDLEEAFADEEKNMDKAITSLATAKGAVVSLREQVKTFDEQIEKKKSEIEHIQQDTSLQQAIELHGKQQKDLEEECDRLRKTLETKNKEKRPEHIGNLEEAVNYINKPVYTNRYGDIIRKATKLLNNYKCSPTTMQSNHKKNSNNTQPHKAIDLASKWHTNGKLEAFINQVQTSKTILEQENKNKTGLVEELQGKIDNENDQLIKDLDNLDKSLKNYLLKETTLKSAVDEKIKLYNKNPIDRSEKIEQSHLENGLSLSEARDKSILRIGARISSVVATAICFWVTPEILLSLSGTNRVIVWLLCTVIQQESHHSLDRYIKRNFE